MTVRKGPSSTEWRRPKANRVTRHSPYQSAWGGRLPWYDVVSFGGQGFEPDTVLSEATSAGYLLGGFDP